MIQQSKTSTVETACQVLVRFVDDERGATAVEYALLASLIGVAIIGATTTLGQKIIQVFSGITSALRSS